MPSGRPAVWAGAEPGEEGLEVLLEESEAEPLTVGPEHLGQGRGAAEEDLHLALTLRGHFLEHLECMGLGKSRVRRGGTVDPPSGTATRG